MKKDGANRKQEHAMPGCWSAVCFRFIRQSKDIKMPDIPGCFPVFILHILFAFFFRRNKTKKSLGRETKAYFEPIMPIIGKIVLFSNGSPPVSLACQEKHKKTISCENFLSSPYWRPARR
ncbi:MAG: hypothetical protein LIP00_12975 [Parabacteroides sp.]|nr:hypothetical protein [Parabacteroides sp.]